MEVDWDDIANPLPRAEGDSDGDEGPAALALSLPHADEALAVIPGAGARPDAARRARSMLQLPASQYQSREQQFLAAARMRDAKAAKALLRWKGASKATVEKALVDMRSAGLLRDGMRCALAVRKNMLAIDIPRGRLEIPAECMAATAFSSVQRVNDVARAFGMDKATVAKIRVLVNKAVEQTQDVELQSLASQFERDPPLVFSAGISGDATKETLRLEIPGLKESGLGHVGRSAWNVMVSLQRFVWTPMPAADDDDYPLPNWSLFEVNRPNVAVLGSETGENVAEALYYVVQMRQMERLELAGIKHSTIGTLHFDLDGHPANARAAAIRRSDVEKATGKTPLTSLRHCGNHSQNLVDVVSIATCSKTLLDYMKVTSYFLHMGTNFLRLVHYTPIFMDRWMQPPTIGHPPALASLIADELEDYFVKNYKNHIDVGAADPGAWSSDEEAGVEVEVGEDEANAQKDRRRKTWLYKDHLICFSNRFRPKHIVSFSALC